MANAEWILERCANERFPFRVRILRDGQTWLALRAQDRWPTANRNIFCLREREPSDDVIDEVERVPIVALQERGRRVSVVLDRARSKRCDFLFLRRAYKGREGAYEQIFWQTQQSMRQRRPNIRLASRAATLYMVQIASDERYPWRFPGAHTERVRLDTGDYALAGEDGTLAVVERKTFENLLADFQTMPLLHQRILELSQYEQHAFVVEAAYEDFLDPRKVHHFTPTFCAAAIAELFASHPRARIVFCANRKAANEWTRRYFDAVWAHAEASPAEQLRLDED